MGLGFQGGVAVIAAAVGAWLRVVGARLDSGTCAGSGPGLGRRAVGCLCTHGMGSAGARSPLVGDKLRVGKVMGLRDAFGMFKSAGVFPATG